MASRSKDEPSEEKRIPKTWLGRLWKRSHWKTKLLYGLLSVGIIGGNLSYNHVDQWTAQKQVQRHLDRKYDVDNVRICQKKKRYFTRKGSCRYLLVFGDGKYSGDFKRDIKLLKAYHARKGCETAEICPGIHTKNDFYVALAELVSHSNTNSRSGVAFSGHGELSKGVGYAILKGGSTSSGKKGLESRINVEAQKIGPEFAEAWNKVRGDKQAFFDMCHTLTERLEGTVINSSNIKDKSYVMDFADYSYGIAATVYTADMLDVGLRQAAHLIQNRSYLLPVEVKKMIRYRPEAFRSFGVKEN